MFIYTKTMQRPMRVSCKDVAMAKNVITQYGGPDGELGASMRYLTQRFAMPLKEGKAILTDIGTEAPEMFLSGANAFFDAFATV